MLWRLLAFVLSTEIVLIPVLWATWLPLGQRFPWFRAVICLALLGVVLWAVERAVLTTLYEYCL